jgi:hypothetical protein
VSITNGFGIGTDKPYHPVRRDRTGAGAAGQQPPGASSASGKGSRSPCDFGFYCNSGNSVVGPGRIDVYAGDSSSADLTQSFTVQK